MMLDLGHPDLAHVRRSLLGDTYEPPEDPEALLPARGLARPGPSGYGNTSLGEHILDFLDRNPHSYDDRQTPYGIGPHWSTNLSAAREFAGRPSPRDSRRLPTIVRARWKGLGEDPGRTHTMGEFPDEKEITMLPGAPMHIDSVQIMHPQTKKWHEVLDIPRDRFASHAEPTVRKPKGILSHQERYA